MTDPREAHGNDARATYAVLRRRGKALVKDRPPPSRPLLMQSQVA